MTKGEDRVRVSFAVGDAKDDIERIKRTTAKLIDELEEVARNNPSPELRRLIALAQTSLEESAMWTVKALTYRDDGDYTYVKTKKEG